MTHQFAVSGLKNRTPKSSSCNLDTDYRLKTKWVPDLTSQVLPCTVTFKPGYTYSHNKIIHIDDLIMTIMICNMSAKICTAKRQSFCFTLNASYYCLIIKLLMLLIHDKFLA